MTKGTRHRRSSWATAALLLLGAGCDDGAKTKPDDGKSVLEGGKPRTDAGRKVEKAKQNIEGAEQQLEDRDERVFEQSKGEQGARGVP